MAGDLDILTTEDLDSLTATGSYRPPDRITFIATESSGLGPTADPVAGAGDAISAAGTYRPIVLADLLQPGSRTTRQPVGYRDGLGTLFSLPGSGLRGRFAAGVPHGEGWVVACLARPRDDLGVLVAALDQVGEDVMLALFGVSPPEPYRTWKALWYSAAPLPYRLGAVLLALAMRTDELRGH